jgi:hypothetical protein
VLSCKPLLTAEEFASTEAHAARFLEALGPQLDTELREYEAAAGRASYLEDFWEDAYLEARRAPPAAPPPPAPRRAAARAMGDQGGVGAEGGVRARAGG